MLQRRPFTLLEVIIVVALMAVVFGLLITSTTAIMDTWEQQEYHNRRMQRLYTIDRIFDNVLSNVIPFTWPDEEDNNRERLVFIGEENAMVAAYIHPFNDIEDGAIRFCALVLEEDELVVYYTNRPPFPTDLGDPSLQRSVLSTDVSDLSFSYADLDEERVEFVESWEDRDYMPLAINVRVTWNGDEHEDWLRRTGGSSYYERWGNWEQRFIE